MYVSSNIVQYANGMSWNNLQCGCVVSANVADNNTYHLLELTELYQYTQLIKEPTRITSSSSTLIDLFLTNEPNNFMTAGVSTIGISDHNLIYAVKKHSSVKSKSITIQCRNYKGFNENNFKRDIESVPWHFVGSYDDPIKAWETWKNSSSKLLISMRLSKREEYEKSVLLGLLLKLRN